jgi:hypothetical protein
MFGTLVDIDYLSCEMSIYCKMVSCYIAYRYVCVCEEKL